VTYTMLFQVLDWIGFACITNNPAIIFYRVVTFEYLRSQNKLLATPQSMSVS
jgi:hypothetical protein